MRGKNESSEERERGEREGEREKRQKGIERKEGRGKRVARSEK